MSYKKILSSLLFFLVITPKLWAASAAETLATELQQVTTFSAEFRLEVVDEEGTLLQQSTGEIAFIRPAQFLWRTLPATQSLICYSDHQMVSYDPTLKQAIIKNSLSNNDPNLLPLTLLTGDAGAALTHFSVSKKERHYLLLPKRAKKNSLVLSVELSLNNAGAVREILYKTRLGQLTKITFTKEKINKKLLLKPCLILLPRDTDLIYDR